MVGIIAWGIHDRVRLRRELMRTYRQRDLCRQVRSRYKFALDAEKMTVDISDILAEMQEDDGEKE
jgi:hypothetical protein